jgi:hypothetical protein
MLRSIAAGLLAGMVVLTTGCALHPYDQPFTHYCSVYSHVPCLDQIQPRADCAPCPTWNAESAAARDAPEATSATPAARE